MRRDVTTTRRFDPFDVVRGFCMGAADVVPGVSGGTVALVFGIYERLVHNIRQGASVLGAAVRLDVGEARRRLGTVEWWFLIPLLSGIAVAILSLARVIDHLLEHQPIGTSAVFLGLVLGSIPIAWWTLKEPAPVHVPVVVAVAVVTFVFLGLRSEAVDEPSLLFVFVAGAIAVCAMILPGISGSFLLLMLGLYDYVIEAVKDTDLGVLAVFGVGAVLGLALFSSVLDWLLRHYHDFVLAGLVGLMIGSLRVLWPWPDGTENASLAAPDSGWPLVLLLVVVAAGAVLTVGILARRREDPGAVV